MVIGNALKRSSFKGVRRQDWERRKPTCIAVANEEASADLTGVGRAQAGATL